MFACYYPPPDHRGTKKILLKMPHRPATKKLQLGRHSAAQPTLESTSNLRDYKTRADLPPIGSESGTGLKQGVKMGGGTAADSQRRAARQHCFPVQPLLAGSYRSMLADRMFTCTVTTWPYPVLCVNHNITKSRMRSPPPHPNPHHGPAKAHICKHDSE